MNMQAPKPFGPTSAGVGASPKRKEDDALLRGKGHFTADDIPAGALRMVVARSAFASADFTIDNLDDVKVMDGVQLLLTAADLTEYGDLPCEALRKQKDGSEMNAADIPLLAKGRACHVGDALAIVIADTEQQAADAAEALDVTYGVALRFLDERLIIRGEGVYQRDNSEALQNEDFQGEVAVEVRLTPDVSLEVFYRRENELLVGESIGGTTYGAYGAGLSYQTEFTSWPGLLGTLVDEAQTGQDNAAQSQ